MEVACGVASHPFVLRNQRPFPHPYEILLVALHCRVAGLRGQRSGSRFSSPGAGQERGLPWSFKQFDASWRHIWSSLIEFDGGSRQ